MYFGRFTPKTEMEKTVIKTQGKKTIFEQVFDAKLFCHGILFSKKVLKVF